MALKKNDFSRDLEGFVRKLVTLNHYQFFTCGQLELAKESVAKQVEFIKTKGLPSDTLSWGSTILMVDIFHPGEYVKRGGAGGRVTDGKDLLAFADEIERRFNAFLMVYLFEALESYLRTIFGKTLYQLRRDALIRAKDNKAFLKTNPRWSSRQGTLPYFCQYAAYACRRDCKAAVDVFDKQLDWSHVAINGFRGMSFNDFIAVLAICRHVIVHQEGIVADVTVGSLSTAQAAFIKSCMYKSLHGGVKAILPPTKLVEQCYEDVASYARGLYVLVSERCGMADDLPYFEHHRKK